MFFLRLLANRASRSDTLVDATLAKSSYTGCYFVLEAATFGDFLFGLSFWGILPDISISRCRQLHASMELTPLPSLPIFCSADTAS